MGNDQHPLFEMEGLRKRVNELEVICQDYHGQILDHAEEAVKQEQRAMKAERELERLKLHFPFPYEDSINIGDETTGDVFIYGSRWAIAVCKAEREELGDLRKKNANL